MSVERGYTRGINIHRKVHYIIRAICSLSTYGDKDRDVTPNEPNSQSKMPKGDSTTFSYLLTLVWVTKLIWA